MRRLGVVGVNGVVKLLHTRCSRHVFFAAAAGVSAIAACVGSEPVPGPSTIETDAGDVTNRGDADADAGLDASDASDASPPSDGGTDGAVDGAACDPSAAFGIPLPVPGLNTTANETSFTITADRLHAVVARFDGAADALFKADRLTTSDPFSETGAAIPGYASWPSLSADGKTLYFDKGGVPQVHYATRAAVSDAFGTPALAPGASGATYGHFTAFLAAPGVLYFIEGRAGNNNAVMRTASGASPTEVLAAGYSVRNPVVTADELRMFVTDNTVTGRYKVVALKRAFTSAAWALDPSSAQLVNLVTSGNAYPVSITPDGCTLYLAGDAYPGGAGGYDIFVTTRGK